MPSEAEYRELVEHAGDVIYMLDVQGRFTYVNEAGLRMFGLRSEEMLGHHFTDFLAPQSGEVAVRHFRRGLEGTEATPFFEVRAIRRDGTEVELEVRAGSLHRDGEVYGRYGIARDITALKRLQADVAAKSNRIALMEAQARVAMEIYQRLADLALDSQADADRTDRALREVEATLARAQAEKLGLNAQDVEILGLLAAGQSNREIGASVHLSPNTVKTHVSKIMRTLGARSRAEVVAQAARRGLIAGEQ